MLAQMGRCQVLEWQKCTLKTVTKGSLLEWQHCSLTVGTYGSVPGTGMAKLHFADWHKWLSTGMITLQSECLKYGSVPGTGMATLQY